MAIQRAHNRPQLIAVAAVVVLGFASALGADAAPSWLPAQRIIGSHFARPQLFGWGDGGATVVWDNFNQYGVAGTTAFATSRASVGGPWSTVSLGAIATGYPDVVAAANRMGDVVVARWSRDDLILNSRDARSGAWTQQEVTASWLGEDVSLRAGYALLEDPTIAVGLRGDAAVVWNTAVDCPGYCYYRLHAVFRPAGSTTWGPEVELAPDEERNGLGDHVAVDAAGNVLVVLTHFTIGTGTVIRTVSKPAGGEWQPPVDLLTFGPDKIVGVSSAADSAGDAVLTWSVEANSSPPPVHPQPDGVFASYRPAGGAWSRPVRLSGALPVGQYPQTDAVVDEHGNARVFWSTDDTIDGTATYSSRDRRWQRPATAPPYLPDAIAPNGNAIALSTQGSTLQTALEPARSRSWSQPIPLTTTSDADSWATVAFDADNHALALVEDPVTSVSVYDLGDSGPVITSLTTPRHPTAHSRGRFSVTAFPWNSPLAGKPRWSFGDGTSANGKAVRHAYMRPGQYSVAVTTRDAAGGSTTASATVSVSAAK